MESNVKKGMKRSKHVIFVGPLRLFHEWYDAWRLGGKLFVVDALFSDDAEGDVRVEISYRGAAQDAEQFLAEHPDVDEVFCCMSCMEQGAAESLFYMCEEHGIRFYSLPVGLPFVRRRMTLVRRGFVSAQTTHRSVLYDVWRRVEKRVADFLLSAVFLLTLFPFFCVVCGIRIKRKSPGPIFLRTRCVGRQGRVFRRLTFRQPEGAVRETWVDRLPMFLNVFFGEMSLVGSRPRQPEEIESYLREATQYRIRCIAKPGLTGWAQICDHSQDVCRRGELENGVLDDFWYLQNWSCWLDLRIMWRSLTQFLGRRSEKSQSV